MHFVCPKDDLLSALGVVTRALSSKPTMPILEGVLLKAENGRVQLTCTDLDLGMETTIAAEVTQEGSAVLPGRLFYDIVRAMKSGEVEMQVAENQQATLKCFGSRSQISTMPAADYPALPAIEDGHMLMMDAGIFREMVRQSVFAVASDESRPILTGSLLELENGMLSLVSLDGHRLALRREGVIGPNLSAVVPGKSLNEISRVLPQEGEINLAISPAHLSCQTGTTRLITRLLSGEFTRYRSILPSTHTTAVTVNSRDLQGALERASLMASTGRSNLVTFTIGGENLLVTSDGELGNAHEEITATFSGNELAIRFNARFVIDVLKVLGDEPIALHFNSALSPCAIIPVASPDNLYLVMPVRM